MNEVVIYSEERTWHWPKMRTRSLHHILTWMSPARVNLIKAHCNNWICSVHTYCCSIPFSPFFHPLRLEVTVETILSGPHTKILTFAFGSGICFFTMSNDTRPDSCSQFSGGWLRQYVIWSRSGYFTARSSSSLRSRMSFSVLLQYNSFTFVLSSLLLRIFRSNWN